MLSQYLNVFTSCWLSLLLTALCAYLLGSVSFAIIVTKLYSHSDIRNSGSGNAGATNVLRSHGPVPAILTTAGDLAKSIASVLIGRWLMTIMNVGYTADVNFTLVGAYLAGLFCIIGHLYPVYFGFRGGKGVLTTLGMMLILDWRAALLCLSLFIILVIFTRMVSLGSVIAALSLPVFTYLFSAYADKNPMGDTSFCVIMTALIAAILIFKHIPNIKRILKGTESKLSFGKNKVK